MDGKGTDTEIIMPPKDANGAQFMQAKVRISDRNPHTFIKLNNEAALSTSEVADSNMDANSLGGLG